MTKTLIVGQGGRESALAREMAKHSSLHAVMAHENPSIIHHVMTSGGSFLIADPNDPQVVADFAEEQNIDLAMVSADNPLEAGVVDELIEREIIAVGPTRAGAEIEWNKEFSRTLLEKVAPEANPFFRIAHSEAEVIAIFEEIGDREIVIKPSGLTGGKGVKVMGPHLSSHEEAKAYALEILDAGIGGGTAVIIEEKIDGREFTIQSITDGKTVIHPPATYDYPYRYENDEGPGTGGMGSYCNDNSTLSFISEAQYKYACDIIEKAVAELAEQGRHYNGIIYGGFFVTSSGEIKVIEFNARFGDPEAMNILSIFDGNWIEVMHAIAGRELSPNLLSFKQEHSLVVYLVSPDYALRKGPRYEFSIDIEQIQAQGVEVCFSAAAKSKSDQFYTVGTSRSVALVTTGKNMDECRAKIAKCIEQHVKGPLEWRKDIGQ